MTISKTTQDLIVEIAGFSSTPEWPGGQSGVIIGFGYDKRHESKALESHCFHKVDIRMLYQCAFCLSKRPVAYSV
jgi:hypothetical protein